MKITLTLGMVLDRINDLEQRMNLFLVAEELEVDYETRLRRLSEAIREELDVHGNGFVSIPRKTELQSEAVFAEYRRFCEWLDSLK